MWKEWCHYSGIGGAWFSCIVPIEDECLSTYQPIGAHPGLAMWSQSDMHSMTRYMVSVSSDMGWSEVNGHFLRILMTAPLSYFGNVVMFVTWKIPFFLQLKLVKSNIKIW